MIFSVKFGSILHHTHTNVNADTGFQSCGAQFLFYDLFFPCLDISLYFYCPDFSADIFSKSIGLKRCLKKVFIHVGKARTILQIFTWATLRFSFLKMSSRS